MNDKEESFERTKAFLRKWSDIIFWPFTWFWLTIIRRFRILDFELSKKGFCISLTMNAIYGFSLSIFALLQSYASISFTLIVIYFIGAFSAWFKYLFLNYKWWDFLNLRASLICRFLLFPFWLTLVGSFIVHR